VTTTSDDVIRALIIHLECSCERLDTI